MRRFGLILFCVLAFVTVPASAVPYSLTDGTKIEGDPISETDNGVVFHASDGTDSDRIPWDKLTQETLRALLAKAKTSREKEMIEPLIEELPQEKAERREIIVKPIQPPPLLSRPAQSPGQSRPHLGLMAVFASPVGLVVLLILYGANIFAAYEVAIYRRQPLATVCGLAAIPLFGVFSPIVFVAMPSRPLMLDGQPVGTDEQAQTRFHSTPAPASTTELPPPEDAGTAPASSPSSMPVAALAQSRPEAAPAAAMPQSIVFRRGDFSFNRRFFETKLAGFFRVVPSESERDMVVQISSGRGNFTGRRITRITPAELYLQVFHDNATADEMIPFVEILEVQIKHKDSA
jgi:hypothetical protein